MVVRSSPHSLKIMPNLFSCFYKDKGKWEIEQGHLPFPAAPCIQLFIYFLINSLLTKPFVISAQQVVKIYTAALNCRFQIPVKV